MIILFKYKLLSNLTTFMQTLTPIKDKDNIKFFFFFFIFFSTNNYISRTTNRMRNSSHYFFFF